MRTSKTGLTAAAIRSDEFYGKLLRARGEASDYPDEAIMRRVYAAEDFYERNLQIRFRPTRVLSNPHLRARAVDPFVQITDYDPTVDVAMPAFTYERGWFDHSRWGGVTLPYRPVISLDKVFYWYPGTAIGSSWKLDIEWLRLDEATGWVQVVPAQGTLMPLLALNAYILSSIAQARDIPQSFFVDYTTGFEEGVLEAQHQDLLEGVRLRTLLLTAGILGTVLTGGRQSISLGLDGLSKSGGYGGGKFGAYSGEIEAAIEREKEIRDGWGHREHGVSVAFA